MNINLIEKITKKPEKEQKNIFNQLLTFTKNGLSTVGIINKLKDLI